MFLLSSRFVLDLVAEPPTTDRAIWFLAGLGVAVLAMASGLTGADSRKRPKNEEASPAGDAARPGKEGSGVGAALRDPWFSVPATSIAFLHLARAGFEKIEEDPESLSATVWLLMPVAGLIAGLVSSAVSRARTRRKEAAAVVDAGAPAASEEVDGTKDYQ